MVLVGLILLAALMIPIVSIVIDSPIGRALARRLEGPEQIPPSLAELAKKVDLLESEVDDLHQAVQNLQEENAFFQRLLEENQPRPSLPPPGKP
jgi:peptidoglycan hydrolase CwlO-like protein